MTLENKRNILRIKRKLSLKSKNNEPEKKNRIYRN
jgi:hypothetical protein